jgi:hypothetical protein
MKPSRLPTLLALLVVSSTAHSQAPRDGIEQMPAALETRFALSALPPVMRAAATVYRLDTTHGYVIAQQGTSGVACLVQRSEWQETDNRDDIYVARCFDAAGARTYLQVLLDAEAMRIQGVNAAALKAEIETRYKHKRYKTPDRAGLSYMLSPVMRTRMPDGQVHTMRGPHVMFYAPNVTEKDIGAVAGAPLKYPFITTEGVTEQTFIIQLAGDTERAAIEAAESDLIKDLCAYRDVLCLTPSHPPTESSKSATPR